jgi:hypothetical protein
MELGPADIATPSFGGYASGPVKAPREKLTRENRKANRTAETRSVRPASNINQPATLSRKRRLPLLELLAAVFLLAGAGVAVWMMHSSLPGKKAAASSVVAITISPESAHVAAGKTFDFTAAVSGTVDTGVAWTVQEGDAGGRVVTHGAKAEGGTVSAMAVYMAPGTPGTYHLVAVSRADPQQSASAEITVSKH